MKMIDKLKNLYASFAPTQRKVIRIIATLSVIALVAYFIFRPQSFDECVKQGMDNAHTKEALNVLILMCGE